MPNGTERDYILASQEENSKLRKEVERLSLTPDRLKRVAKVLKAHFTNLSVEQTIDIAAAILAALDEP